MYTKTILKVIMLLLLSNSVYAGNLYVVVSNNLKGTSFSAEEIRRILLGEISVIKNARVRLIYPSYSSPEIVTLSKFVGKGGSVRNLKSYWSKMIFTGKGIPPLTANSTEELNQMLQQDNSIGVSNTAVGNVIYTIHE